MANRTQSFVKMEKFSVNHNHNLLNIVIFQTPLKIKMINAKRTKHETTFVKVNEVQSHLDNLPIHYWTLLSYQHSSLHLNSH